MSVAEHLTSFAHDVLGVLIEHDRERQSQLIETIRTLVQCNFHYRTAAELLYTHPNTLRYRMSRIIELTDLDFTDADDRLKVEIALRILDVIGPVQGSERRCVASGSSSWRPRDRGRSR